MAEARQGQLLRAHGAARRVLRLADQDLTAGLGEPDCGCEAVRACAGDDRPGAHDPMFLDSWTSMLRRSSVPQNACWAARPASL